MTGESNEDSHERTFEILRASIRALGPGHELTREMFDAVSKVVAAAPPMTNADAVRICRVMERSEYFRNLP